MLNLDILGDLQLTGHLSWFFFSLQGLNQKQFLEMYKRAYPHALNSKRLANSVFRLCDRNIDGIIDFTEFAASICIPPTRYVYNTLYQCPS